MTLDPDFARRCLELHESHKQLRRRQKRVSRLLADLSIALGNLEAARRQLAEAEKAMKEGR